MLNLEWSARAALVVTSLIFDQMWTDGLRAFYPRPWTAAPESNNAYVCVLGCVCVSCLCVSVCALEMNPLLEQPFTQVSLFWVVGFLGVRCVFCLRGERLIGVSGLSHPWLSFGERSATCLTALALLDSRCLWMELQSSPRWMFLSTRSGTIHWTPSSSSSSSSTSPPALSCVFPLHFCPRVLPTSPCPLFCCTPCPLTAPVCRLEIQHGSTLTSALEASARDQWSQWWQAEIWKHGRKEKLAAGVSVSPRNSNFYLCVSNASCFRFWWYKKK